MDMFEDFMWLIKYTWSHNRQVLYFKLLIQIQHFSTYTSVCTIFLYFNTVSYTENAIEYVTKD